MPVEWPCIRRPAMSDQPLFACAECGQILPLDQWARHHCLAPAVKNPALARFYLGTHMPAWLTRVDVPLFVSQRRLAKRRTYRPAHTRWALDSGAFTEIYLYREYATTPAAYIAAARRYRDEIGRLDWIAPQDHMCEPFVLATSRIARTVPTAQRHTVDNYLTLRTLAPDLPIIPVLQGQTLADYWRCADMYERAGVDLHRERLVGLGSVCRREATDEIAQLVANLSADGLRLHGFGVKTDGLRRYGWCLTSADSMAWSYRGRNIHPCPHTGVKSCANCLPHALAWRERAIAAVPRPVQLGLAV